MHKMFGITFTDGAGKTEPTKEPEAAPAAPAPAAETKEQPPEDKKVLSNNVLLVIKKPRSHSLIAVYVRVNVQRYNCRQKASLVFAFIPLLLL